MKTNASGYAAEIRPEQMYLQETLKDMYHL